MFRLSTTPIHCDDLKNDLSVLTIGAVVTFEGIVRNHNDGRKVLALEYEAYEELAVQEAAKVIAEARQQFDIMDAHCAHRIGKLTIGDVAVWVGVSAAHRDSAFKACRYIIDEIKKRLPIWKKEYYTNGDSGWVNCQQTILHS